MLIPGYGTPENVVLLCAASGVTVNPVPSDERVYTFVIRVIRVTDNKCIEMSLMRLRDKN